MDYKQLTVNDVEGVADELLAANGQTTTLDIKNRLRDEGFWAVQYDVANSMYLLWEARGWHWTFNGTYRIYYQDFDSAEAAYNAADEGDVYQTSWLGWLSPAFYSIFYVASDDDTAEPVDPVGLPANPPTITEITRGWAGDWYVYDYRNQGPSTFYSCDVDDYELARQHVRTRYSRDKQVPREHVGASRIKSDS